MNLNVAELDVTEKLNGFSPPWLKNKFLKENIGKHNSIATHTIVITIAVDGVQQIFLV